jgi:peptide/nickel transport system permease protein
MDAAANPQTVSSTHKSELPKSSKLGIIGELLRRPNGFAGAVLLFSFLLAIVVGPFLLRADPTRQDLTQVFLGISVSHPLGTDELGRDELARLAFGGRYSMAIGALAVSLAIVVGVPLGAISGYFGGVWDLTIQRLTDVMLSFPGILLALALVAGLGVGFKNLVLAVGLTSTPVLIRVMRASVLTLRELPYVEAARSLGASPVSILARHVVPNSLAPIVVQSTLQLGTAILTAACLGFLGLGVPPPTPEWGQMLGEARSYVFSDPLLSTAPGVAICGAVLGFNLLGDALRDVLDPRRRT